MRIATANLYDASIANLQNRQTALQTQQQQLTSGKRVASAGDVRPSSPSPWSSPLSSLVWQVPTNDCRSAPEGR